MSNNGKHCVDKMSIIHCTRTFQGAVPFNWTRHEPNETIIIYFH